MAEATARSLDRLALAGVPFVRPFQRFGRDLRLILLLCALLVSASLIAGVFTLRDSGAAFSDPERGRAGRPFTRFGRPGTITGTVTGASLGLAIAMELARRMGGAMRLTGQDGPKGGATLEVRMPKL